MSTSLEIWDQGVPETKIFLGDEEKAISAQLFRLLRKERQRVTLKVINGGLSGKAC
jgi:hypothetical protein